MKTAYVDKEGLIRYVKDMPVEPESALGIHASSNECREYLSALERAKQESIPFEDQEKIKDRIIIKNFGDYDVKRHKAGVSVNHLFEPDTFYSFEGEVKEFVRCKTCGVPDDHDCDVYKMEECDFESETVARLIDKKEESPVPSVSTFDGNVLLLWQEFQKAHDEYQDNIDDPVVNPKGDNTEYFRGKADAYGYAARQIKNCLKWHGKLKD